ncbi:hypothetical protein XBI1_2770015 [Xenorhabdus bovienii str. Intermedium]|uniref:Uncharacterized protein n=1 Tax=Xenorhabdus bovienii str. Intermedium TaxID=1379677 RepID=A0A077QJN7_XENBV|nr:hypothetical protein XBI1_2770015 [Xenorhabdus bovienii str. Intermedium]
MQVTLDGSRRQFDLNIRRLSLLAEQGAANPFVKIVFSSGVSRCSYDLP